MRFYNKQHRFYCGIDLHARTMFVVILDQAGEVLLERNVKTNPKGDPAPSSGQRRGILRARELGAVDVLVPLLRVHPLHEEPKSKRQLGD